LLARFTGLVLWGRWEAALRVLSRSVPYVERMNPKTEGRKSMANAKAILTDINLGTVVVEGAVSLFLKLKGILRRHAPDVKVDIQTLTAEAQKTYAADLIAANEWLKAHGFPEVKE
jgi:hypothetical protein